MASCVASIERMLLKRLELIIIVVDFKILWLWHVIKESERIHYFIVDVEIDFLRLYILARSLILNLGIEFPLNATEMGDVAEKYHKE
jgi:hypothetical protein